MPAWGHLIVRGQQHTLQSVVFALRFGQFGAHRRQIFQSGQDPALFEAM